MDFLDIGRRALLAKIEVELCGFTRLCPGVGDRCFELPIDDEHHSIGTHRQAVSSVMAGRISLNNFGKMFRFNPNVGTANWAASGVSNNAFKNRCAGTDAKRHKKYAGQGENE